MLRLSVLAVGVFLAAYLVPGIEVTGYGPVIKAAVLLGLLNLFIRPFLFILTLPINLLTLGLFTLVINGFLLWLAGRLIAGFEVSGFFASVLGALVISLLSVLVNRLTA